MRSSGSAYLQSTATVLPFSDSFPGLRLLSQMVILFFTIDEMWLLCRPTYALQCTFLLPLYLVRHILYYLIT